MATPRATIVDLENRCADFGDDGSVPPTYESSILGTWYGLESQLAIITHSIGVFADLDKSSSTKRPGNFL